MHNGKVGFCVRKCIQLTLVLIFLHFAPIFPLIYIHFTLKVGTCKIDIYITLKVGIYIYFTLKSGVFV